LKTKLQSKSLKKWSYLKKKTIIQENANREQKLDIFSNSSCHDGTTKRPRNHYKKIRPLRLWKLQFATVKTVAICHLRRFVNRRWFRCRNNTLQRFWKPSLQLSQVNLQRLQTVVISFSCVAHSVISSRGCNGYKTVANIFF
jgi:hypothetical protein